MRRIHMHVLMMLSVAMLSGCGPFVHRLVIAGDLKATPLVPRVPAAVGVYYEPGFAAAEYAKTESYASGPEHHYYLSVGPPSVQFFDQVLPSMFDEVAHVDDLHPTLESLAPQRVIGLLAPSIEAFFFSVSLADGRTECRITYSMAVHGVDGSLLAKVSGDGSYFHPPSALLLLEKKQATVVHETMRRAIASLIVNFYENPEVRAWLQAHDAWPSDRMRDKR